MTATSDRSRVRRAALAIGLYVGIASAVLTVAGVAALVTVISLRAREESIEHGISRPRGGEEVAWVVERDEVIGLVVVLGAIGIVLVGLVAWLAAHRAVAPLAEALRLQRNFVADASHELRTPLTVLTSRLQVLERRLEREEPAEEVVGQLRADAASMADVINDLLLSAEGDAEPGDPVTAVADTVRTAVSSLEVLAQEAGLRIETRIDATPTVAVPRVSLARCVVALVDNAVQHSPAGAVVEVLVGTDGGTASLRVRDSGPGIQGISPERVFDRFARSSGNPRRRSFGLGLALVRDIARRYHGDVTVESTSPQGTTLLLQLPCVR
ncbi:signal transduction histidine kinase [Promicromonospora sp. AC04]|uniref:sensor histidine kinase n=1 Tax=Promicromonospora sp. AC04 TaxID=2135723 RepID=UPI000D39D6D7|nr:HAMP domain-containing sensor histidine kinase [Promicromonospora sp. AC04]PUB24816.1 signal transduction histidine kinase [Promicromonospora sp. AC04]